MADSADHTGHAPTRAADAVPAWRDPVRLAAANISPATGLATDFLNAFNEPVMLIDLLADMPDMLDELNAWAPVDYAGHFRRSGFQARDLAILAFTHADPAIREPFDRATAALNRRITETIADARRHVAATAGTGLAALCAAAGADLRARIAELDAMIHGGAPAGADALIDAMFD